MHSTGNPIHINDVGGRIVEPIYTHVTQVDSQPHYSTDDRNNGQAQAISYQKYVPPTGQWKDGIFECYKNLWPSFGCVACGGTLIQLFYAAQISTRIQFIKLFPLFGFFVVGIIVLALFQLIIVVALTANINDPTEQNNRETEALKTTYLAFYFPEIALVAFVVILRFKFIEYFRIRESGFETLLYGICCFQCSLCQMGRHLHGYSQLFDGDGRTDGYIEYPPAEHSDNAVISFSV